SPHGDEMDHEARSMSCNLSLHLLLCQTKSMASQLQM
ncbi:hypothetical protein X975_08108, partial [Stegodyphus mimosarum]